MKVIVFNQPNCFVCHWVSCFLMRFLYSNIIQKYINKKNNNKNTQLLLIVCVVFIQPNHIITGQFLSKWFSFSQFLLHYICINSFMFHLNCFTGNYFDFKIQMILNYNHVLFILLKHHIFFLWKNFELIIIVKKILIKSRNIASFFDLR